MTTVKETTSIRLDKDLKDEAKKIFAHLGITMGEAVNMFLAQSVFERGLPFDVKIPPNLIVDNVEDVRNRVYEAEQQKGINEEEYEIMMNKYFKEELGVNR